MKRIVIILMLTCALAFAQDTTRIACIGNSITYGAGIGSREMDAYPAQLERLLGEGFEVGNFGVSGRTMLKNGDFPLWNEPEFAQSLEFNPNIVIILLGTNDTKPQNWAFKDEYVPDYISMIDTFRTLETNPEVYVCYPPPAFELLYDIRDSIIVNDMIPMLDVVLDSTDTKLIDFNTPLLDQGSTFPDGIHPDALGSLTMAEIAYQTLTGDTIQTIHDYNLAATADVYVDNMLLEVENDITDSNVGTAFTSSKFGESIVLDFKTLKTIDQCFINFGPDYQFAPQYQIKISNDNETWQLLVDKSTDSDSLSITAVDNFDPIEARFVALSVSGFAKAELESYSVFDFGVMEYTGYAHNPVFNLTVDLIKSSFTRYLLDIIPTTNAGEQFMILSSRKEGDGPSSSKSFRQAEYDQLRVTIRSDQLHKFTSQVYDNGCKIVSTDTLVVTWAISDVKERDKTLLDFQLEQNYPNPFNPQTTIRFQLQNSADVSLIIYNSLGQKVYVDELGKLTSGVHSVVWNGFDTANQKVPSGVYFYRINANDHLSAMKKMVMLK